MSRFADGRQTHALDPRVLSCLPFGSGTAPLIEFGDSCVIERKYVLIKLGGI